MEFKRPRSSRRRLRPPKIQWPASNKDILKLFTLSRTNQILRGRSPILQDKEGEFKDQGVHKAWSELVASEILSAKVDVVPKPLEYNVGIVSSDPRKGRYERTQPQRHLCKTVRKNIITGILEKYNLIEAKVDHGLYRGKKRKKPSKRELEDWKIGRAKDTEGWKQKQKYKHKKVISSKRRGYKKYKACDCCGDYHFKRVCTGADLKVNLLVRQINVKTDVIKQNMDDAWAKLAELEETFTGMLSKTYRLQSQRVCLEMLSGEPGDGHPDTCPCAERKAEQEAAEYAERREEALKRKLEQKEEKSELEKKREQREQLIAQRKKSFYKSLKKSEEEEKKPSRKKSDGKKEKLEKKKRDRKDTLDDIRDDLLSARSHMGKPLEGVWKMDGSIKKTTTEYVEEGGMIFEVMRVDTMSLPEESSKKSISEFDEDEDEQSLDEETLQDEDSLDEEDEDLGMEKERAQSQLQRSDEMPFAEFLNIMEIF